MRKSLIFLILSFSFLFCNRQQNKEFDQFINTYYNKQQFSGVVLVADAEDVLFNKAYGYANIEKQVANTIETQFLIGSLTKSFTAVLALRLWDQNLVDLDKAIAEYVPLLREPFRSFTLRQLIQMRAGLPPRIEMLMQTGPYDVSTDELIDLINGSDFKKPDSLKFTYSNFSLNLAAIVLAKATESTYPDLLARYIFKPLAMTHSGAERIANPSTNKAIGYELGERSKSGHAEIGEPHHMAFAIGSGDIYSTSGDLLKWAIALNDKSFLSPAARNLLLNGNGEAYGFYSFGFRIHKYQRADSTQIGNVMRHGGSMHGYLANLHNYLDDQLYVIVLGNIRPFPIMDITVGLKEIYFGRQLRERNGRY